MRGFLLIFVDVKTISHWLIPHSNPKLYAGRESEVTCPFLFENTPTVKTGHHYSRLTMPNYAHAQGQLIDCAHVERPFLH